MEFDVKTQKLKCPNCDTVADIVNNKEEIVEHSLTRRAMQRIKAGEKKSTTMQCRGCGAQMELDGLSTAVTCPYCGSSYVMSEKQAEVIVPDGVVPFKIDKNNAREIVGKWLKKRHLAPNELKVLYQKGDLFGMYVPYWTFDAKASAEYTGMGGRHRTEHYRDSEGKTHTRTVTDWYPTRGRVNTFFDDVLISASTHQKGSLLRNVDDYNTKQLVSYAPDYFSGYGAETFNVDLDTAHDKAMTEMNNGLRDLARRDILRRYDEAKDIRINSHFSDETYKHVMFPLYTATYHYKNKVYNVLINGQTGNIKGEYPKSVAKILLIIIAAAVAIFAFIYATSGTNKYDYRNYGGYGYEEISDYSYCENLPEDIEYITDNSYYLTEV